MLNCSADSGGTQWTSPGAKASKARNPDSKETLLYLGKSHPISATKCRLNPNEWGWAVPTLFCDSHSRILAH